VRTFTPYHICKQLEASTQLQWREGILRTAGFITKVGRTLGELVGAFVLSLTVVAVVALGIFSGFGAVLLILQAFAPPNPTASGKPSLVANQAQAAHAGSN
jgi:hypothetical protein